MNSSTSPTYQIIIDTILQGIFSDFNEQRYLHATESLNEHIVYDCPAIDSPLMQAPAVHFENKQDVLDFWKAFVTKYNTKITKTEYLQIGKHAIVRCYFDVVDLCLDVNFHIDPYGKVYKLFTEEVK